MDWVSTTYNAIEKARKYEVTPTDEGSMALPDSWTAAYSIPSHSVTELVRMITVSIHDGDKVQFNCTCRTDLGLMQPPVGWISCWHMGAVVRELLAHQVMDFDRDRGFIPVNDRESVS